MSASSAYPGAIGNVGPTEIRRWTERDVMLYALGVGAAVDDPTGPELRFVAEDTEVGPLCTLPTFAAVLGFPRFDGLGLGDFPRSGGVDGFHGEQGLELQAPLPTNGSVAVTTSVADAEDKGTAAVVRLRTDAVDPDTGSRVFTTVTSLFLRGEGGFDPGSRVPAPAPSRLPERAPDHVVTHRTSLYQPLLYRLSGDRHPMHADPAFARRAGFPRPIMHGLCTLGYAGRALVATVAHNEAGALRSIEGRFTRPFMPGDALKVQIWRSDGGAVFRVLDEAGHTVINRGRAGLAGRGRRPPV